MSKISVIIPAYNAEKTILQTIDSVLNQSFVDFDLIVINDGSTDRTAELVQAIEDPRLTLLSFKNGGLPTARNRGIANSTGPFITFIDADDLWTTDKLKLQVEALEARPEAGVVYSWTLTMSDDGTEFNPGKSISYEGNVYSQILANNFIASGSNVMIRREAVESIGGFDPALKYCEDWDYWVRLAAKWPFAVVQEPQILYRQTSGSMSSKLDTIEENYLIFHDKAFQNAPPELQYLSRQSRCSQFYYLAQLSIRNVKSSNDILFSLQRLGEAIRSHPKILLQTKPYVLLCKILFLVVLSPTLGKRILRIMSKAKASEGEGFSNKPAGITKA